MIRHITTTRGPIEVEIRGEGPAVLAVHGAMGGHDQSMLLARTVGPETGFRYLAVSRPGYLGTPMPGRWPGRRRSTPAQQADLHAALLDALGLEQVIVMAVSGGGLSATSFAARHPTRCRGLVLVSAPGGPLLTRPPLRFHLMCELARVRPLVKAMARKAAARPEASARRSIRDPAVLARTLADPVASGLLAELTASTMHRLGERIAGTRNDIATARRFEGGLGEIRVPVLVVHGTADRIVPFAEHGAVLARDIPGAELLAVEGGEHVACFTHRELVRPRVAEFLARLS